METGPITAIADSETLCFSRSNMFFFDDWTIPFDSQINDLVIRNEIVFLVFSRKIIILDLTHRKIKQKIELDSNIATFNVENDLKVFLMNGQLLIYNYNDNYGYSSVYSERLFQKTIISARIYSSKIFVGSFDSIYGIQIEKLKSECISENSHSGRIFDVISTKKGVFSCADDRTICLDGTAIILEKENYFYKLEYFNDLLYTFNRDGNLRIYQGTKEIFKKYFGLNGLKSILVNNKGCFIGTRSGTVIKLEKMENSDSWTEKLIFGSAVKILSFEHLEDQNEECEFYSSGCSYKNSSVFYNKRFVKVSRKPIDCCFYGKSFYLLFSDKIVIIDKENSSAELTFDNSIFENMGHVSIFEDRIYLYNEKIVNIISLKNFNLLRTIHCPKINLVKFDIIGTKDGCIVINDNYYKISEKSICNFKILKENKLLIIDSQKMMFIFENLKKAEEIKFKPSAKIAERLKNIKFTGNEKNPETVKNLPGNVENMNNSEEKGENVKNSEENVETVKNLPGNVENINNLPENVENINNLPENVETVKNLPENVENVKNLPENVENINNSEESAEIKNAVILDQENMKIAQKLFIKDKRSSNGKTKNKKWLIMDNNFCTEKDKKKQCGVLNISKKLLIKDKDFSHRKDNNEISCFETMFKTFNSSFVTKNYSEILFYIKKAKNKFSVCKIKEINDYSFAFYEFTTFLEIKRKFSYGKSNKIIHFNLFGTEQGNLFLTVDLKILDAINLVGSIFCIKRISGFYFVTTNVGMVYLIEIFKSKLFIAKSLNLKEKITAVDFPKVCLSSGNIIKLDKRLNILEVLNCKKYISYLINGLISFEGNVQFLSNPESKTVKIFDRNIFCIKNKKRKYIAAGDDQKVCIFNKKLEVIHTANPHAAQIVDLMIYKSYIFTLSMDMRVCQLDFKLNPIKYFNHSVRMPKSIQFSRKEANCIFIVGDSIEKIEI